MTMVTRHSMQTHVRIAAETIQAQQINDWNYFWNVTLNPQNTGWDDFWFQCQDPDKTTGDCVGTVFAGLGIIAGAALAITGVIVVGTAITPVAGWGGAVPAAAIFAA